MNYFLISCLALAYLRCSEVDSTLAFIIFLDIVSKVKEGKQGWMQNKI
jgi:hypothetical protein